MKLDEIEKLLRNLNRQWNEAQSCHYWVHHPREYKLQKRWDKLKKMHVDGVSEEFVIKLAMFIAYSKQDKDPEEAMRALIKQILTMICEELENDKPQLP